MAAGSPTWRLANGGTPLVLGHRGASALETENTTAAFERAARDGADGVELDVLLCATGEVVVFHDDDLLRLGGRKDLVGALDWETLRRISLAGGGVIPTLDQALEACGPTLLVNVELKSRGLLDARVPALVQAVDAVLRRHGGQERFLVSSFDAAAVLRWRRQRPQVLSAVLLDEGLDGLRRRLLPRLVRPGAVHPHASLCTAERLERWHRRGYLVNTWTVDDPERARTLARAGVDGIITNDPGRLRRVLA